MKLLEYNPHRRALLKTAAGAVAALACPLKGWSSQQNPDRLIAAPTSAPLVLDFGPPTEVWAFNQQVPGPLLRYRQGDTLRLKVDNRLSMPTTIHWHGLRVPVGMDGVPWLSQEPIAPGQTFHYEFELKDAGTFWYHPHFASSEQVGKGLSGVLIVDEREPIEVDRDIVWMLDDWRLNEHAQIVPFGANMRDASHNGRLGNVVTVNGDIGETFMVHPGERLRLRLINAANARTFALQFQDLEPWVIALDGHPINPVRLENDQAVLGASQRMDLIIDITGAPGDITQVIDRAFGPNQAYELKRLVRGARALAGKAGQPEPARLPDNPVSVPTLTGAKRIEAIFEGGAMGAMRGATINGEFKSIRELVNLGKAWSTNGMVPNDVHFDPPQFTLELGQSYIFELENRTVWEHPIHLHGHSFQILSRNGKKLTEPVTRDTVLLQPEERSEIAFVADNPGKWLFHCHILEHQSAGMASVIEVV